MTTFPIVGVRRIVFPSAGAVELEDAPDVLAPEAGQVTLRPLRMGICGSDLHVLHGNHPGVALPVRPGHEVIAEIIAVGDGVPESFTGRRALINPLIVPDGNRSNANVNENARVLGFRTPGLAATAATVDAIQLHFIPDDLDPTLATMAEPLAVAIHGVRRSAITSGAVLIIGAGTIGLCTLSALLALTSCTAIVVEPSEEKRELARKLGATRTIGSIDELSAAGFDAVFDCVVAQATLEASASASRGGGRVVMMGVPRDTLDWKLPLARMQRYEIDLIGSAMYTPDDLDKAIRIIADGTVNTATLVSEVYAGDEAAEAFAAAQRSDTIKVVIELDRINS